MPELPEVESIKLQLQKFLIGHKIEKVEINYQKAFRGEVANIEQSKIENVRRFGKALVIDLDNGYSIVIHIKMTGQLIYRGPNLPHVAQGSAGLSKKVIGGIPGKHTHIIFNLDRNGALFYNDVRKFGWVHVHKADDIENHEFIGKLGKEFLNDINLEYFGKILKGSLQAIKVVIMDQQKMAGVGNIYANDALWLAGINPRKQCNKLNVKETDNLFNAIENVLKEGIERGGASELSFVTPDGGEGNYQDFVLVYGKEGKICKNCNKQKIEKYFLGGRGTYWCPVCQK